MKILHITPHLGGGVGRVLLNWVKRDQECHHVIAVLDYINDWAKEIIWKNGIPAFENVMKDHLLDDFYKIIHAYDIVLVHYWDHRMLVNFMENYRHTKKNLIYWCHKNFQIPVDDFFRPDYFVATSPIIFKDRGIEQYNYPIVVADIINKRHVHLDNVWSTGGIEDFINIKRDSTMGFNIGYLGTVDYKKMSGDFLKICACIHDVIPEANFYVGGEPAFIPSKTEYPYIDFLGHIDDVPGFMASLDVFLYPLRSDHYGTCEQVLGEAMAAGVVPVAFDNGAEQLIISQGTGFLCKNIEEMQHYVNMLHRMPDKRMDHSYRARMHANSLYDMNIMIEHWHKIFKEVMFYAG
jgi:glycosyltransferase involved in cell wall biosynthesis